jgi:hypothetical protein
LDSTYKASTVSNASWLTHFAASRKEIDRMKKVTVHININNQLEEFEGYLLDSTNVIYIGEGSLKIVGVQLEDWKYKQTTSHIILGEVPKGISEELLIYSVINRMKNTTVYDFLLNSWDRSEDIDFDFIY